MKKLIAVALAALFTSAAGLALADGMGGACNGKKCSWHHGHKKGAKHADKTGTTVKPESNTNITK